MTKEELVHKWNSYKGIIIYPTDNVKELINATIEELEKEPCEDCCSGNQIEKAKLCQRSYIAGMEHRQEPKTDILDKIKEIVKEWKSDTWSDNVSYECMTKISELLESEG